MSYNLSEIFIPSEHDEQCNLVCWFRLQYPHLTRNFFAIPNGGHRNIVVAKKLKNEGVSRGVADLFLMAAKGGWHGLFIEMKPIKGGQQTENQKEFEKKCKEAGYKYFLARGCKAAQDCIREYLQAEMEKTCF